MTRNEIIEVLTRDAHNQGYTLYACVPFRQREGVLPGALVLTDKVKGELAIHDAYIKDEHGVQLLSGIYPRESLEECLLIFAREIIDASWRHSEDSMEMI